MGRTQCGNNNTYCRDNELNWLDWRLLDANAELDDEAQKILKMFGHGNSSRQCGELKAAERHTSVGRQPCESRGKGHGGPPVLSRTRLSITLVVPAT